MRLLIAISIGLSSLLFTSPLLATLPTEVSGQILYLIHKGNSKQAFVRYLNYVQNGHNHDFAFLQQAAIKLLEQGIGGDDPDIHLMCMFGAGIAHSPALIPVLEKGIQSKDQRTQLIAMNYLGKQQDDLADKLILDGLSSPFLLTRLEGCYQLAHKNHPAVLPHLQSLMVKVPAIVRALFPQIVVQLDGIGAQHYLKQLLIDPEIAVCIEAILAVAKSHRDDFLPQIRSLATGAHHAQQECCALALGTLQDMQSIPVLKKFITSARHEVKLAAAIALFELGERETLGLIEEEAQKENLFAIAALGKLRESKALLKTLSKHPNQDVRLNATLSLLQQLEITELKEILIEEKRNISFMQIASPGGALKAWKTISSHLKETKGYQGIEQQTLGLREKVLTQCLELEESQFLPIAQKIIERKQTQLIPLLVSLLENTPSQKTIDLLKEGAQKAGEPLIRNYCTLALYRLRETGSYESCLIDLAKKTADQTIIQFREEKNKKNTLSYRHELTPEETSRFLIETFETLAQTHNQAGLEALIHAMAYGNAKNRYALAGLLLRTTE